MILLQFHERFVNYHKSGALDSEKPETCYRKVIVVHNYIELIEQENGTCIINDNKAGRTYRPIETYEEILDKLSIVADIA